MKTVSAKPRLTVATAVVITSLLSGCSALLPSGKGSDTSADTGSAKRTQHVMASGNHAPLPKQKYSLGGEKIPYEPESNPYNNSSDGVSPDAVKRYQAAATLKQQGELKKARKAFKSITEDYPDLSGPWFQLGEIAELRENVEEAIAAYQHALEANKHNVNAYIALGLLQRKQGYFGDAQHTYLQALETWKDFPEAHLNLAILYDLYVNQPEQAQKHYEAYDFLTQGKNENVKKWLVEVKRRTGIEKSFIDNPPAANEVVEAPAEPTEKAGASDTSDQASSSVNSNLEQELSS